MPEKMNLDAIKATAERLICPECDGNGYHTATRQSGKKIACDTCGGHEDSQGSGIVDYTETVIFLLHDVPALIAEVERLRAALDAILNIVSPKNDPPDEAFTLDGIVANVRQLAELQATTQAALNAEREACDDAERRAEVLAMMIETTPKDTPHSVFCNGVHAENGMCEGHVMLGNYLDDQRQARERRLARRAAQAKEQSK
jgi:DNA-directed RNA polymerase subunit M/transcription elongation factor TFIIS